MRTTAAAPPSKLPPTADPSVKMVRSESHLSIAAVAADLIMEGSAFLLSTPSNSANMTVEFCACHGGLVENSIGDLSAAAGGRRASSSRPSRAQLLRVLRWGMAFVRARLRG